MPRLRRSAGGVLVDAMSSDVVPVSRDELTGLRELYRKWQVIAMKHAQENQENAEMRDVLSAFKRAYEANNPLDLEVVYERAKALE